MLTIMSLNQWMIACTGLVAVALLMFGNSMARYLAPVFGLCGQPFWIMAALDSHQPGVLVVSLAYTVVWIAGLWRALCAARDAMTDGFLVSDFPEGGNYGGSE